MAVSRRDVAVLALYRVPGRVGVRRWRSGTGGGWSEAFVTLGRLPDGDWFVEDTRGDDVAVFAGADARAAAREHAGQLMAGGVWERSPVSYGADGMHPDYGPDGDTTG